MLAIPAHRLVACLPFHRPVRWAVLHGVAGLIPRREGACVVAILAAALAAGAVRIVAPVAMASRAAAQESSRSDRIRAAAREAYVWGWPLAYVRQCRARLDIVMFAGRSGGLPIAPVNELAMLTDRVVPTSALVPCPGRDVLYGFGMFDLARSPVVVQVPDFGERFWLYQLGDQRTDGFAQIGSMYGTRAGCYLVVGPGWDGPVPDAITGVLRCPTRHAYCIPRIFFTSVEDDRSAAVAAAAGVMAYPVQDFTGRPRTRDWSHLRWLPKLSRTSQAVTPQRFLDLLPALMDDVPPLPGEEPLYARFRSMLASMAQDPRLAEEAESAVLEAEREVVAPLFEFRNVGRPLPAGWTTIVNGADFGTDYLTRTAVARSNIFVNRHRETKYYYLDVDAAGRLLHGDESYVITFPPGAVPPASAFWSLTAYDDRHSLHPESADRHAIGSRDATLRYGPDGSLTIVIDPAGGSVTGDASGSRNRIEAPAGTFSLYLRLYEPQAAALDGSWTPPAVWRCRDAGLVAADVPLPATSLR